MPTKCVREFLGASSERTKWHFFSRRQKGKAMATPLSALWESDDEAVVVPSVSARVVAVEESTPPPHVDNETEALRAAVEALRAELAHRTGVFFAIVVVCVFVLTHRLQRLEERLRFRPEAPRHPWW